MQHLDIVFFAIVAVVLGWKLYSVLGRRTGSERRIDPFARPNPPEAGAERKPGREDSEAPIQMGTRRTPAITGPDDRTVPAKPAAASTGAADAGRSGMLPRERRQIEADIARAPEAVRAGLAAIARAEPAFDAADFVGGARIAFGMIVEAFAAGDLKSLQPLLAGDVNDQFAAAVAERQRRSERLRTDVIGITQCQITGAELSGREARITLRITSEQTSVTEDAAGTVIDGDPQRVETLTDTWTFARDTGSRDPNWQLAATESPE